MSSRLATLTDFWRDHPVGVPSPLAPPQAMARIRAGLRENTEDMADTPWGSRLLAGQRFVVGECRNDEVTLYVQRANRGNQGRPKLTARLAKGEGGGSELRGQFRTPGLMRGYFVLWLALLVASAISMLVQSSGAALPFVVLFFLLVLLVLGRSTQMARSDQTLIKDWLAEHLQAER